MPLCASSSSIVIPQASFEAIVCDKFSTYATYYPSALTVPPGRPLQVGNYLLLPWIWLPPLVGDPHHSLDLQSLFTVVLQLDRCHLFLFGHGLIVLLEIIQGIPGNFFIAIILPF